MEQIERKLSCSIITPLYNHKNTLLKFNKEIDALLVDLGHKLYVDFRIIYIDDGSKDETAKLLNKLKNITTTSIVVLDKNYGQTTAISVGLKITNTDCAIIKSSDNQDPFILIENAISAYLIYNKDIIFHRNKRKDGLLNQLYSKIFYTLISLFYKEIPKGGFDFVLLKKETIRKLNERFYPNRFLQFDILKASDSYLLIPSTRLADNNRKSGWTFSKKIKYSINSFKAIFGYYKYDSRELDRIINLSTKYNFNQTLNI